MALPQVVIYNLSVATATTIALSQGATSAALTLNGSIGSGNLDTGGHQRRIIVTSAGNDSLIGFKIVGFNQALMTVSEVLPGGNATFAQSTLDYLQVVSISPVTLANSSIATTTSSTVTAGTNGVGSSLWNYVNQHVSPVNIEFSGVVQTSPINYSIQYTYDDPNNLPAGVAAPQPFNHPTIVNLTSSLDGPTNDPIMAWRLLVNSGTGTVRATGLQAGIAG